MSNPRMESATPPVSQMDQIDAADSSYAEAGGVTRRIMPQVLVEPVAPPAKRKRPATKPMLQNHTALAGREVGADKTTRTLSQDQPAGVESAQSGISGEETTRTLSKDHQRAADSSGALGIEAEGETTSSLSQDPAANVDPSILDTLIEQWRQRQMLVRAEVALTLQIKSYARRLCNGDKAEAAKLFKKRGARLIGEAGLAMSDNDHIWAASQLALLRAATEPLEIARAEIHRRRLPLERWLENAAQKLPAAGFVKSVNGFGWLGFAGIVAEAGDLTNYSDFPKLWKRFGLAVSAGRAEQPRKGETLGFSPQRRAWIWAIGSSLIKAQNPYRELYLKRKENELARGLTPIYAHKRAQRYMEKALLKQLWRAWNRGCEPQKNAE